MKRWAEWPKGARRMAVGFVAVIFVLGIAWVLFVPATAWLANLDVSSAKASNPLTARDNARARLLTLGAGLFAAGALIFTARNYTLSREGQVTDRYTKAIEQLGSESSDVCTGGIYALERVARDSARDHPTVVEVLTAFVRENSRKQRTEVDNQAGPEVDSQSGADAPRTTRPDVQAREHSRTRRTEVDNQAGPEVDSQSGADVPGTMRPDVQAAVDVIGRRDPKTDRRAVNFNDADLTGADLTGAQLAGAKLNRAVLEEANLTGADLTGAQLVGANLTGADLTSARLTGAWLPGAKLTRAVLEGANLTRANLAGVTLTNADLDFADLEDANLTRVDLTSVDLSFVYLTGAVRLLDDASVPGDWKLEAPDPARWRQDSDSRRLARTPSARRTAAEEDKAEEDKKVPVVIRKYLFPTEGNIINVRMHPAAVMAPILLTLVGMIIAVSVISALPGSAGFMWFVWMLLFLWGIWRVVAWRLRYFAVTKRRIMLVESVLNIESVFKRGSVIKTRVETLPLTKVTDVRVHRTTLGYLLGYGDFIVESAGQEQAIGRVPFMPYPEQLRTEIVALIQRTPGRAHSAQRTQMPAPITGSAAAPPPE